MKYLFTILFLYVTVSSYSQTISNTNYLLVRIEQLYDNTDFNNYYTIRAESGCDAATDIYKLKPYINKKNKQNIDAKLYFNKSDSLKEMYNYFYSSTEILNYLSEKGFTLVTIYNDIFSSYNSERSTNGDLIPITTVGSRPVFCFKK